MRILTLLSAICVSACLCGCEGDYQGKPDQSLIEVKDTPDMDPRTDHDVDVNPPDVDVDVHKRPGALPDLDVDVLKTPDKDTKANQP